MKRIKCFVLVFLCSVACLSAQNKKKFSKLKPVACDCKDAIPILLDKPFVSYGPTIDTSGYGKIQEIPIKEKFSKYYFEEEHNSAWYLLKVLYDGDLVFDIKPKDSINDYDFLLFPYLDSSTFCNDFLKRKLIPVRSNIAANEDSTGHSELSVLATNQYAVRGKGNNYSKAISVKKGERYMLVLDNVTPKGRGHTLIFKHIVDVTLSGIVKDDSNKAVKAEITVQESNGSVVAKTISNKKTGAYSIHTGLIEGREYFMNYSNDSSFFVTKTDSGNAEEQKFFYGHKDYFTQIKEREKV